MNDRQEGATMKKLLIISLFIVFCGVVSAADTDWSKPETIDIDNPDLVKNFDVNPERLMVEGWKAYQDKQYEKATQYYLAYLQHVKNDAGNIYNLACCYGLLGKAEPAAAWLEKSVEAGWKDMTHLKNDPDFASVRETDIFKATVDKLEKKLMEVKSDPGRMLMVPSRSLIPVYIKLPAGFDPEKTYPLVVGLHGYGDNAEKFASLWDNRTLAIDFIYAAMEAPYAFQVGKEIGYSWFLRMDPEEHAELVNRAGGMTDANVLAGIDLLKNEYKIDKVYLLGFSQGAGLTYITGLKHPELFAGIAPFGGWMDTDIIMEDDLNSAKNLPVLIVHGSQDTMVEIDAARKAEEILKNHGFNVRFITFEGGHVIPEEGLKAMLDMVHSTTGEKPVAL